MIKKTVNYVDFNGTEVTEAFYFHFSQAELLDMELGTDGGFVERVQAMIDAKDQKELLKFIKKFVYDSYGVKSPDGKRFIKNEEVKTAFVESPAYSKIFMELVTNDEVAAEFVNGVIPDDLKAQYAEALAKQKA